MVDKDRRKFLEVLAGTAGSAALAGCSGILGDDDRTDEAEPGDNPTGEDNRAEEDDLVTIVEDFDRTDLSDLGNKTEDYRNSAENHRDAYEDVLDDFNDEFTTDTGQLAGVDEWVAGFQVSDEVVLGYQESPLNTNQEVVRDETTYVRPDGVKPPLRSSEGMPTFNGIKQELSLPDDVYEELELDEPKSTLESKINSVKDVVGRVTPYVNRDLDAAIEDLEKDKERLDEIISGYQDILKGGEFNADNSSYDLKGVEGVVDDLRYQLDQLDFIQIPESDLKNDDVKSEEIIETGARKVYDESRNLYLDTAESLAKAGVLRAGYGNWISQLEDTRETYGRFYEGDDEPDPDTPSEEPPSEPPSETPPKEPSEEPPAETPEKTPDYEVERRQVLDENSIYEIVKDPDDGKLDSYDTADLMEDFVDRLEARTGWDVSDYDDLFDGDPTNPMDTTRIDLRWERTQYGEVRNTGIKFWFNFEQEEDQFTTESLPEGESYIGLGDDFGQDLVGYVSDNSLGRSF